MPERPAVRISEQSIDYDTLTDADLVAFLKRGDAAAFGAVIQRHNQRLFRIARSVVGDDAEAEDVVQETYVRAFASLSRFRGEASLSTWLTRIALNEAIDRVRQKRPQVELKLVEAPGTYLEQTAMSFKPDSAADDPEKATAVAEIRRLIESAVDRLPEPFRVVFVMREIEEMSVEETSSYLDLKPETVKTRLHRARLLLRAQLEDTLSAAVTEAFPFAGKRCASMTEAVLARLAAIAERPIPRNRSSD
jgi:RNA polymerase sigma-70 factor, ECF subfamily